MILMVKDTHVSVRRDSLEPMETVKVSQSQIYWSATGSKGSHSYLSSILADLRCRLLIYL